MTIDDWRARYNGLNAETERLRAEVEQLRKALGEIAAVTSQLGPDRASSQYMAEQAHGIASAFLANAEPRGGLTNQDHVWQILDDVLLLLAGQYYPTPERTYKLDGGWSLALADLKRCFGDLRADLALVKADLDAERTGVARLRAEVERLREDAARNRWCEEKRADVKFSLISMRWHVFWVVGGDYNAINHVDRNAAIDAGMRGGK